jgi:CheY-like chemotaxis protein
LGVSIACHFDVRGNSKAESAQTTLCNGADPDPIRISSETALPRYGSRTLLLTQHSVNLRIPPHRTVGSNRDMPKRGATECPGQNHGAAEKSPRRFCLVLADDHDEVREQICQLLDPEFEVLRAVDEGVALVEAAAELKADAVVTDIQMPRMSGIEAGGQILKRGLCDTVVMLSMYADAHLVNAALQAGIRAYVLKVDASEELIPAIYAAMRGERYLSQGVRSLASKW